MLSVVSAHRGVTEPRLRFSDGAPPGTPVRTFIDYTYRHHAGGVSPQTSPQEVEVTQILSSKRGSFDLGGLTSASAPDLDDNDAGMLRITDGWGKKCGLTLFVMTD